MSDTDSKHIRRLIDLMQSGLVELFDQLRELRQRLDLETESSEDTSTSTIPLFSEITKSSLHDSSTPKSTESIAKTVNPVTTTNSTTLKPLSSASPFRLLDPIAYELQIGEASAEVIAEYLEAAKTYLARRGTPDERVIKDMNIVLNFLRARGKRGIRPTESDNILKRISRWKIALSRT